ncbi:MAG: type I-E CRISPR-associated protein Cse2/CasB [Firmicutes bacterium]|uniref:Type I-E CRISPR-associated protein Cse2/CasB n=1 Tax=Geochorda subterranea TaxID=3109564 RepID=A0ABZ1BQ95_9FIRM|nr:type I-E CRISPR-associated protein Cse2/CasB [Limnochorda sp. LNt]NLG68441.1 type I-E CRISPR-associated protein Cse2/CasB [Bacillota bacterium]WRP14980.1 type I-E CRISPR-associated protein Cse2/CasB [Limnochorda sp. LNt]
MRTLVSPEATLHHHIGQIARVIASERFPTGERAALRRMHPTQLPPVVFYRFAALYLPEWWDRTPQSRRDWITLVAGIALMSPAAHNPDKGLGRALAEARYSEARLERLLTAEGDTRRVLLLRAARFLAAKSSSCNWVDAALLLLTQDPEKREAVQDKIARDFYYQFTTQDRKAG